MGGYDLDEYEDYEDEDQEDVGEYEEEEEEERLPTQEELEYLELRQKLKESIRKKMKKDSGSSLASKKNKMPYNDYGSFFGPSQPVIAQRVIQESKSLLENPHLAERDAKPKQVQSKGGSSTSAASKPRPNSNGQPRKVDNWAKPKAKIQMLKNTRDYSFLLSDDAELPVPPKNPPRSVSAPRPEAHISPRPPINSGRKVINGHEERRPLPPGANQTRPKPGQLSQRSGPPSQRPGQLSQRPGQQSQRPGQLSKPTSAPLDSRKQLSRYESTSGQKALPSKTPISNKQKIISPPVARSSIPTGHKPNPSRTLPPPTQKRPLEHKRDDRTSERRRDDRGSEYRRDDRRSEYKRDDRTSEYRRDDRGSSKGNVVRRPVLSSKPQMKQQPAKVPSSAQQRERPQKRPARPFDDDDDDGNAISMIRSMFRYNPNKYRNDDDDSDMEAGFDDIMREEKLSARIAAKEDEEELKKIEEEERRERMRKEAKRRKLSQR